MSLCKQDVVLTHAESTAFPSGKVNFDSQRCTKELFQGVLSTNAFLQLPKGLRRQPKDPPALIKVKEKADEVRLPLYGVWMVTTEAKENYTLCFLQTA